MILSDSNILLRSHPSSALYPTVKNALARLSTQNQVLCIAPQNLVLDTWHRIVVAHGISGKQTHDAHLVAMMQVHSVESILTFNEAHFRRFPGIRVLNPSEV